MMTENPYLQLYYEITDSMQIVSRYSPLSELEFCQFWHEKYEKYKAKFPDSVITKSKGFYG
jgi:hypothetical protein